ncbi:hypothetical protein BZM27_00195 [Paraburkholderia steynii]|uniref:HTH iclR-type domain-containing protein n=1 Tax=Paraburkholderia steynii TaxID=1245441 RepID=A0A4R0XIB0_9BURK|nr:hypothetical protein BZM27_00195 [Paraburkholderia steynii]
MHAHDRLAAIAVLDRAGEILRSELGDEAQAVWPVLSALLQSHLQEQPVSITTLADLSGLPRTSARRIIFALKAKGWLEFRATSGLGSRATIVPSAWLLDRVDRITEQTVQMIVGATADGTLDRFDAVNLSRAGDAGVAWPHPASVGFNDIVELTLVAYEDPVFEILKRNRPDIERFVGHRVRILTFPQVDYRARLDQVLKDESAQDETKPLLIAIPFPWLAELSRDGHLLELENLQAESNFSGADFYEAIWAASWFDRKLYAIPLQPTVDFLWYRQDLLEAEGLDPPRSFDDVLRIAERMHRPRLGRAGITWSAAPGLPIAETFLQILGAQGAAIFDDGVLQVDTEMGRHVIEYLRALVPFSPTRVSSLDWARNARLFGAGKAAMCYHWSNRYGVLDSHALLQQGGRVGLQLHPTYASDMVPLSPLGGALLAIPASNPEPAARWAWRAIETLTSSELTKYFVLHGAAGSARQSVAEDRYVKQRNRVIAVIDRLANDRQIQTIPSPALANYRDMTQTLSDHLELLLFDGAQDIRKGLGALQRALSSGRRRER